MLIALLSEAGFGDFEEKENTLLAYVKEDGFMEDSLNEALRIVPVNYTITVVAEQNWNAQWERSFEPILVMDAGRESPWVAIRADFHQPVPHVLHEIIITPKMSFGTGHHATTYLMIEQMQQLDVKGKTVLDFGTGTAVLAILAEKMGAVTIDAIDYDQWSINNAQENLAANNCSAITLIKDETIATGNVYDILLANINLNVINDNITAIKAAGKKQGFILLSGFLKSDEWQMQQVLIENGIHPIKTRQKLDWICILAQFN